MTQELLPSERIILRVWLEELAEMDANTDNDNDGTTFRQRNTAARCGVTTDRVYNLIRQTPHKQREECRNA